MIRLKQVLLGIACAIAALGCSKGPAGNVEPLRNVAEGETAARIKRIHGSGKVQADDIAFIKSALASDDFFVAGRASPVIQTVVAHEPQRRAEMVEMLERKLATSSGVARAFWQMVIKKVKGEIPTATELIREQHKRTR
jgi:hypothetical protein